ncbi:hypothetical protein D1AOALGA4SA_103 [Olavius algarvensis Delta 1 endosymbiont]|nr:hypothetical protein D1AOALGA4SA_103 [Olavius algarvensis Delta 1 endosymbiont]
MTERSDTTNLQSSIFNIQFRLVRGKEYRSQHTAHDIWIGAQFI